jgi:hypothetical protein
MGLLNTIPQPAQLRAIHPTLPIVNALYSSSIANTRQLSTVGTSSKTAASRTPHNKLTTHRNTSLAASISSWIKLLKVTS